MLGIMFGLERIRLATLSSIFALVVPTFAMALIGWESVERVAEVRSIPRGIPEPALPEPALFTPESLLPAFALAVVIAVQGAGVSQSVKNPDGSPINVSRDLVARGAANVASGRFSGIPACC